MIHSFDQNRIVISSERDSIQFNIYKCIKGYQMPNEEFLSSNFSSEYITSLQYLYKKGLGDYLSSFVNNLYLKLDLYSKNSSQSSKLDVLHLLELSSEYSLKDLNKGRFYSKIDHFNSLKNISFLYHNLNPDKTEEILIKINKTLRFFEDNKSFLESKGTNDSYLYFMLVFKASLLYKTGNKKEEIIIRQNIIDLLYKYRNDIDINYKVEIANNYHLLIYDSLNTKDFQSLFYLINKHNAEISDFDLLDLKEILETTDNVRKLEIVKKFVVDFENDSVSKFKQKSLSYLINYLIIPYGNVSNLSLSTVEEKKIIIHYYYIRYLIEKNNDWSWKLDPERKIYSEKIYLNSFHLVYSDFHSADIDINFKVPFDFLKSKNLIINEIINTNNKYAPQLTAVDFIDKIDYEISEYKIEDNKSDDEYLINILNKNITFFKKIRPNYVDQILLLKLVYVNINKLIFGLNYHSKIDKKNKLSQLIKSFLIDEVNLDDLKLRINICNDLDEFNIIKDFVEKNYKINNLSYIEYVKFINDLNFLEFDIYEEQILNSKDKTSKFVDNDLFLPLAKKPFDFFISNLEYFNNYNEYIRIIDFINKFNFEPNISLINKYLTFYNSPGKDLTNAVKFHLDKNLGELYYKIKNYSKARRYFYAANANPLVYEDGLFTFQKWDILMNIYFCNILDTSLAKEEIIKSIAYLKKVFEYDINRINSINNDNLSRMLNEIKYKYHTICIYEAREQNDFLKEKELLIQQLEINNVLNLYSNYYVEIDLINCKSELNEITTIESYKLITELYAKYNKKQDIQFAILSEKLNDFKTSFNIQLNLYSDELLNKLNYINKLSFSNQIVFFKEIWEHRQYILRPYFNLNEEDKLHNLNNLINYFLLSDNIDGNNFNLYANNSSNDIDALIAEKKKLFNRKLINEDYNKISNNIDLMQQKLKYKENSSIWNLNKLKENLKKTQAYIRMFLYNGNYFAFLITSNDSKLIDLNDKDIDFEKAFSTYSKNIKEQVENTFAFDIFYSKIINALPKEINELFFQNEGVYINLNPDGFKSNITQRYLIEDYNINTINTSYLLNNLESKFDIKNALFIGDPKFQNDSLTSLATVTKKDATRGTLLPLPNTRNEVIEVSKLLNNEHIQTKNLLETDATEENLNKLSSSYELLHIATHGFYKDDGTDKINQYNFGLYLTGAMDYINKNQEKIQMIDEGIIYAPEIELLNLSKTKLVVLSACETGFGIQSKIGKVSLSSSFIMAGAKNVLSTLWKIDDKVTMEFINEFYKKLVLLKNIKVALKRTQLEFLAKYKSPYYWAPFTLLQNRG